ncbi:4127_t:CDS:2, partial [Paraglomus occultum]
IQSNPFELSTSSGDSDWKLENGELVKDVLAQNTAKMVMWSKERNKKDLNAYILSVLRLGLSFIVDLSSEFPNGMCTWFGEGWAFLKAKVYEHVNVEPKQFEGSTKELIDQIDKLCCAYQYVYARNLLLDKMKDQSETTINQQIIEIYLFIINMFLRDPCIFIDEDGQRKKLTELEYVMKVIAPILDIVFSDLKHLVELRWGETMSKVTSKSRKIDMRIVHRVRGIELSHTECARFPTPVKAVRDRAKLLRTNKCILDHYLMEDPTLASTDETVVFGLQFAGLNGQFIGVDLLDDGLYFGLEGPVFSFPIQLSQIKKLRRTLEILYFFK